MRLLAIVVFSMLCSFTELASAQDLSSSWTFAPPGKTVVVTRDFCNACKCCELPPNNFSLAQGDLAKSFGTTNSPPVMKKDVFQALRELQSSPHNVSPSAMANIVAGAGTRGLVDMCNACKCCKETADSVIIDRGGNMEIVDDFAVFQFSPSECFARSFLG